MALNVMCSEKGKPIIVFDNYKFYKYRTLKSTSETVWCCVLKSCRAKLYTLGENSNLIFSKSCGSHEHEAVIASVLNRERINNGVKRKADECLCERPSKIIHKELSTRVETMQTFSRKDMTYVRNNLGRMKRQQFPKLPKSSKEFQECLNTLDVKTIQDEDFLLCNDISEGVVIFACKRNLEFMCAQNIFYMDGTFDHCPKYYFQLFTIHVLVNTIYVPVVFCLLKDKRKSTYVNILRIMASKCEEFGYIWSPDAFVIDFEKGIHTSVSEVFPYCKIIGCRFHLAQAWYRKILQIGLSNEYRNPSSDIGKWLHYVFGLTYLPPHEVGDAFSFELAEDMPNDWRITQFADYLTDTYICESANFPPEMWADHSADISRTTNCCESFHSKFKTYCSVYHPNIHVFLKVLGEVQTDTYIRMNSVAKHEKFGMRIEQERTIKFMEQKIIDYKNNKIGRYDFLKCMSYKFSSVVL